MNLIIKYKINVIIIHIQLIIISYRMEPKNIRIHKAIAEKVKIVNYANQNSIHMTADKYGLERKSIRNWREKKTVAGVTKNVTQIYQKYSSSWRKNRN